jgi:hypothetical protein
MRAKTTPQRSKRKKAKTHQTPADTSPTLLMATRNLISNGRGRYDLGRGSAHASCRQIFLRRGVATKLRCPLLCKVKMSLGSF